jgi:hypothetical protein
MSHEKFAAGTWLSFAGSAVKFERGLGTRLGRLRLGTSPRIFLILRRKDERVSR